MNHKAFTLIELLVVVAIIGILAAVGVVAYNGYTKAAKVNVVKSNLKMATKFISTELMKCIGTGKISTWSGAAGNPPHTVIEIDCDTSSNKFAQNSSLTFEVFSNDSKERYPNPFNANDNKGGFSWTGSPPKPEEVGRVHCSKQDAWDHIKCWGRWGTGTNDYDYIKIEDPF